MGTSKKGAKRKSKDWGRWETEMGNQEMEGREEKNQALNEKSMKKKLNNIKRTGKVKRL